VRLMNQNKKNKQTPGYAGDDSMPQDNQNTPMGGTDESESTDINDSGSAGGAVGDTFPTSTVTTDEDEDTNAGMTPPAGNTGDFTETDES
jgi:hypothetical protein